MRTTAIVAGLILSIVTIACADNSDRWPNWRGPRGDGSITGDGFVTHVGAESNLLWKVPLPSKGSSTPVVWDDHIFVTTPAERQDALLALDWNGKERWRTKLGPTREGKHRNSSSSNAAPITDGKSIFVTFTSGCFAALDFSGKILWQTNLIEAFGRDTLYFDAGTAPVLTDEFVVMARMNQGESWLAAFDKRTGALRWKVPRNYPTPQENDHGYNTPLVIRFAGDAGLLVWAGEHLTVHRATDGKLLWSAVVPNPANGKNYPAVATPVVADGVVIVPFGRNDRGNPQLFGIPLGQPGELDSTNHLWQRNDTGTFVPSPTVWNGKVCLLRDRGELECLDPRTGATIWKESLPKTAANYYASTTIADGKLYAIREDGRFFVATLPPKFEVLTEHDLEERVVATPVLLKQRILVRGEKSLFCFGAK